MEVKNVNDFLKEFKNELLNKVKNQLKPLITKKESKYEHKFKRLERQLLKPQKEVTNALVEGFKNNRKSLILCAEMGCGKTIMGIATAYVMGFKKIIVLCPTHLVKKWEREIYLTYPENTVMIHNLNEKGIEFLVKLKNNKNILDKNKTHFFIVGKEKAKLHFKNTIGVNYFGKKIYQRELTKGLFFCPTCGKPLTENITEEKIVKKKIKCEYCKTPLYQADRKEYRRYSIAEFCKRYLKKYFDLLIADEVHEYKGKTAQGEAFAIFCRISKFRLALTGTLMGGYASNLYYIFWRMFPKIMAEKYNYNEEKRFIANYGILERIKIFENWGDANTCSIGNKKREITKEKPGVSPLILSEYLLENTVFMRLNEIAKNLPSFNEEIITVEMMEEQKNNYFSLENELSQAIIKSPYKIMGKMLNSLLAYPDTCRTEEIIYKEDSNSEIIAYAPAVKTEILPKEKKMLEIIQNELKQNRKVLVYLNHTGTRDITGELKEKIEQKGIKVAVLKSSTTSTLKREKWIKNKAKEIDVLITNPEIVKTGLDLFDFPTIIFFQTGYNIYTLRQASRRSWRIGQKNDVKVYYLAYTDTIQEKALKLIADKMEKSLMLEGDLSDKGLTAIAEGDSMIMELAKSLVNKEESILNADSLLEKWQEFAQTEIQADMDMDSELEKIKITESVEIESKEGKRKTTIKKEKTIYRGYVVFRKSLFGDLESGYGKIDNQYKIKIQRNKIYYGKRVIGFIKPTNNPKIIEGKIKDKEVKLWNKKENLWYLYEKVA